MGICRGVRRDATLRWAQSISPAVATRLLFFPDYTTSVRDRVCRSRRAAPLVMQFPMTVEDVCDLDGIKTTGLIRLSSVNNTRSAVSAGDELSGWRRRARCVPVTTTQIIQDGALGMRASPHHVGTKRKSFPSPRWEHETNPAGSTVSALLLASRVGGSHR